MPLFYLGSGSNKTASAMSLPSQYEDYSDKLGYDTVDDYALPLNNIEKPWQHLARTLPPFYHHKNNDDHHKKTETVAGYPTLACEAFQVRTSAVKGELDDESDDERIMDLLGEQLEEEMMAIEEGDEMHRQETSIRVMFLGAATEKDKRVCIQKLSQALLIRSRHKLSPSNHFKERKHQIVRGMSEVDEPLPEDNGLGVQNFEDIGLSIIEADFSWSTGRRKQALRYASLLLQHCSDQHALAFQDDQDEESALTLYPKTTEDNRITLCIYFYEDNHYLTAIEEDLDDLRQIQSMEVPIVPILVGDVIEINDASERRTQLADLLALYMIQPKTFGAFWVHSGPPPSFTKRSPRCYQVSNGHTKIENQWRSGCIVPNHMPSVPYSDILTIHQFAALNGRIISDHILENCTNAQKHKHKKKDSAILQRPSSITSTAHYSRSPTWFFMVLTFAIVLWFWNPPPFWVQELVPAGVHTSPLTVHVSLSMSSGDDRSFIHFNTSGGNLKHREHHHIPIPTCTLLEALPLGTVHIDSNSFRVDPILSDPAIVCSTSITEPTTLKSYYQKMSQDKYWIGVYQTVIFLLEHHSRIFRTIFTKTLD